MTLLITLASPRGVHQSSDYRLTDSGRVVETANGTKQLGVSGKGWTGQISFTGIARDGRGYDTRAWLSDTLLSAALDFTIEELSASIRRRAVQALTTIVGYDARLSILLAAVSASTCRLFLLSNWESLTTAPASSARKEFDAFEVDVSRPRVLVNGYVGALPHWARRRLTRLVTQRSTSQALRDAMAWANRIAAANADPFVSEGCWVQSLLPSGHSSGTNYGEVPGTPSNIHLGEVDWTAVIAGEFPAAPGKQLTLHQSVGVVGTPTPVPTETGEPRSIQYSSPTGTLSLAVPGHSPFAQITIAGLTGELVVRKNAWSVIPFGTTTVELNLDQATWPVEFHRKRVPLRNVPIVDGGSPRNWDYSLDIRWDGRMLEVHIAQMSVALRSANLPSPMPVLKENEELVMVAPPATMLITVTAAEQQHVASLEARFLLRDFPELLAALPE